jgi:glycosyltransferase involved in cell wall biosynthesis
MLIGIDASRAARIQPTGTEAYSRQLIQALLQIESEHRFILYSPTALAPDLWGRTSPAAESAPENPISDTRTHIPSSPHTRLTLRVIPCPRLWTHGRLTWELWRDPPDVLFVPAHVMPLVCPVPALVTVHDLGYLHYPQAHRPFDRWYLHRTTRRHVHKAAGIVADSEATRQDLVQQYQVDPNRIIVIYPGRDRSLVRVEDPAAIAAVRERYRIKEDYLLYLGTLQPRKNLVRLVEAFARLQAAANSRVPPTSGPMLPPPAATRLQLVLAGKEGWLCDDLFQQVRHLGLENQVVFPGYIAAEDKAALISGALALVFPSLFEGFGLPVLEAMACGTPVLTSNVSSMPEVAGQAALLVDPLSVDDIAAGLRRLSTDGNLRHSLVQRGYAQIQGFSWQSAARQLLEALESVVHQNPYSRPAHGPLS